MSSVKLKYAYNKLGSAVCVSGAGGVAHLRGTITGH